MTAAHCFCNQENFKCEKKENKGIYKWFPKYNLRTTVIVHFGIQSGQVGRVTSANTRGLTKIVVHPNYSVGGTH